MRLFSVTVTLFFCLFSLLRSLKSQMNNNKRRAETKKKHSDFQFCHKTHLAVLVNLMIILELKEKPAVIFAKVPPVGRCAKQ